MIAALRDVQDRLHRVRDAAAAITRDTQWQAKAVRAYQQKAAAWDDGVRALVARLADEEGRVSTLRAGAYAALAAGG